MDKIGKMYDGRPSGTVGGRPVSYSYGRSMQAGGRASHLPSHTESFYRTLREASPEPSPPPPESARSQAHGDTPPLRGLSEAVSSILGSSGQGSLGSSISNGLSSFLKKIGDDDVLLLLMIVILLNENKQDDYLILIILGVILLT